MDKATAQRILAIWGKAGATSPDALRKLLLRRSASRSQQIAVQLLIDAAAGGGAFYAAAVSDERARWVLWRWTEPMPIRLPAIVLLAPAARCRLCRQMSWGPGPLPQSLASTFWPCTSSSAQALNASGEPPS